MLPVTPTKKSSPTKKQKALTPQNRRDALIAESSTFQERRGKLSPLAKALTDDLRTVQQKETLLLWANEYHAAGYKTPEELVASELAKVKNHAIDENFNQKFASDEYPMFVNDEKSSPSRDKGQPIKVSLEISHNYNVALHQVQDAQGKIDQQLFETMGLNSALRMSSKSSALQTSFEAWDSKRSDISPQSKQSRFASKLEKDPFYNNSEGKARVVLDCLNITCTIGEIPDPPPYSLSDNPRLLIGYWEGTISLGLQIRGILVPLKYWREVYAYNRPEVWKRQKESWSRVQLCYYCIKTFSSWEEFELAFGETIQRGKDHGKVKITLWTKLWKKVLEYKKAVDADDARKARELAGDEFSSLYYTRHGRKRVVLARDDKIARRYRLKVCRDTATQRFWDNYDSDEDA